MLLHQATHKRELLLSGVLQQTRAWRKTVPIFTGEEDLYGEAEMAHSYSSEISFCYFEVLQFAKWNTAEVEFQQWCGITAV